MNYTPTTDQFICVINKKISAGRALNALGHMTAGLTALHKDHSAMRFQTYVDKDGTEHPSISDNGFIVLRADNGNKIRTLRNMLNEKDILFTDFTDTMIEGTYAEQHDRTLATPEIDLEYHGICFFMNATDSRELTKKFSLYSQMKTMKYVILAYPKLSKSDYDWIQEIRKANDRQFEAVEPHFTIVFPTVKLSETEIIEHVESQPNNIESFAFALTKAVVEENIYPKYFQVHLIATEEIKEVVALHDLFYVGALASELRSDIAYVPHVTIASHEDKAVMQKLADEMNAKGVNIRGNIDTITVGSFDGEKVIDIKNFNLEKTKANIGS